MNSDIQDARYNSGRHPSDEELVHYLGGRLDEADKDSLQNHLVECDVCLAAFRDAREFFESHRANEPMITVDIADEWKTFWNRINAEEETEHRSTEPRRSGFLLSPALAFAAAILLVTVAMGIWGIRQRQESRRLAGQLEEERQRTAQLEGEQQNVSDRAKELEQENLTLQERSRAVEQSRSSKRAELRPPELNAPIYDLYPRGFVRRSEKGSEVNRINVPPGARSMTLILNGEGVSVYPSYVVEILDGKGQLIWRGRGLKRGNYGNFTITLDPAFLGKGTLRLKLYGPESKQLAEYFIHIE